MMVRLFTTLFNHKFEKMDDDDDSDDYLSDDVLEDAKTLEQIRSEFNSIQQNLIDVDKLLQVFANDKDKILEVKSSLASYNGNLEDLMYDLDALELSTIEEKNYRKELLVEFENCFDLVFSTGEKCAEYIRGIAESEKIFGNDCFKAGNYPKAIVHYTTCIDIDPSNHVFFTNRALTHQKLQNHSQAVQDASTAVRLDVNFLKAYVILIKSQLALSNIPACHETLGSIPIAHHQRSEVIELKTLVSASAKDTGNAFFKKGSIDEAIRYYEIAITWDSENHLLYSNRSAAYQSKGHWREALQDAEKCIHLDQMFPKGYLHMARAQVQLRLWRDAETTLSMATSVFSSTPEYVNLSIQLTEIADAIRLGKGTREAPSNVSGSVKAEQFKERGNAYYKSENYQEAVRFYTQAISLCPDEGAYYGNRAAAWMMIKEYRRAIADCIEGISFEKSIGALDKLRVRHASALIAMGESNKAVDVLQSYVSLEGRVVTDNLPQIESLLQKLRNTQEMLVSAMESLDKKEYTRAKRLFQMVQNNGFSDDPKVVLGIAKCCLFLEEFEEASREAQKVISIGGNSSIEAYVVRADALQATGCTDLAKKHLVAALQMDPDNAMVQLKLKNLKRNIAELGRIRDSVDTAMNQRKFDVAISLCGEGLQIDRECKKIVAEFHARRAKAYSMLAKMQFRGGHHAHGTEGDDAASDAKSIAIASWRRCLQDAHSSIYYDNSSAAIPSVYLKCEALQALERYEEAMQEVRKIV